MGTHWFSLVPNRVVLSQSRANPTAFSWLRVGELEEGWEGAGREHRPSNGDEHEKQERPRRDGKLGGAPAPGRCSDCSGHQEGFSRLSPAKPAPLFLGWGEQRNMVGKARPEGKTLVLPAQQTQEISTQWTGAGVFPPSLETTRDDEGAARSLGSHHSGSHLYPQSGEVRISWTQRAPASLTYQDTGRASALESILQSREVLGVRPHPSLRGGEAAWTGRGSRGQPHAPHTHPPESTGPQNHSKHQLTPWAHC